MRVMVALVCGAFFATFILISIASSGVCSEAAYKTGDEWVYDFDMQLGTITLSGKVTYSFDGESSRSVAGFAYSTYEIGYMGSLTVGGTAQGYTVSGTATLVGTDSLDQASLDTIVSDSNLSMTVTYATSTPVTAVFWEHNITTYSPPSGIGEEPENPAEGVSWTKTQTEHYESMAYDNGDITEVSSSVSVTTTYTYLGVRTITVPAGKFDCNVTQEDYGDGITTNWYCDDVGSFVKSSYQSGSSTSGTQVLTSYIYTPPDTTPPTVSMTGPPADAQIRGGYVDVAWQSADNTGVVSTEMRIDGGTWETVSGNEVNHLRLSSGHHVIEIRVADKAGNQAVNSISFDSDNGAFSFGGPYYGLPTIAIIVAVILVGLFVALTVMKRRRAPAAPPPQPPATPPGTQ